MTSTGIFKARVTCAMTHHRTHEVIRILLELLQSIQPIASSFDNLWSLFRPGILEDAAELVMGRRSFSDVQLESFACILLCLITVVGSLIFRRSLCRVSRGLLEQVCDADGGGKRGFVEERDDVEGFVLVSVSDEIISVDWTGGFVFSPCGTCC